jgi:pimeloyl-ACP methyl ester carboxylesterase
VLLLHGFPELAYSWRKLMLPLAAAGLHVLAPDQRGYGRTTGWSADYHTDLRPFAMLNLVRDMLALLHALKVKQVAAVVGHDFGSPVAAWCALARPDVFGSLVMMSAPFGGPPSFDAAPANTLHADLAALPRPRKHYQAWYTTAQANADLWHPAIGLPAMLRAYYHCKSADWPGNRPFDLGAATAAQMALLPDYYVMDLHKGMAETAASMAPGSAGAGFAGDWLSDDELAVYAAEYRRTGFQGGLQWYRCAVDAGCIAEQRLFAGRTIDVPATYIAGASDWGMHQKPGELQRMQQRACTDFRGLHTVPGAGHWVQQEQPLATAKLLLDALRSSGGDAAADSGL